MSNIIIPVDRDPIKRGKDCPDWEPLEDGTKTGDTKYCNKSLLCRQLGFFSDFTQILDVKTGEIIDRDYLCTGMKITDENKGLDEEIS